MSTVKDTMSIDPAIYGYQLILGLGTGLTFSSATMMTVVSNSTENAAVAQGAISQARVLGGSIGLAIATIVLNNKLSERLSAILSSEHITQLQRSFSTIHSLEPQHQAIVGMVYSEAFKQQMQICAFVSVGCLAAALATFSRNPPEITAPRSNQEACQWDADPSDQSTTDGRLGGCDHDFGWEFSSVYSDRQRQIHPLH